jgi:hypothetical protein
MVWDASIVDMVSFNIRSVVMTKLRAIALLFVLTAVTLTGCAKRMPPPDLDYPQLANYFLYSTLTMPMADSLARYDVLVLTAENQVTSRAVVKRIRQLNPHIKVVAYVASNEIAYNNLNRPEMAFWRGLHDRLGPEDWLMNADGSYNTLWVGCRSFNLTRQETADKIVTFIMDELDFRLWDGVFIDNIWYEVTDVFKGEPDADRDGRPDDRTVLNCQWVANERYLLAQLRQKLGPNRLLIANEGGANLMVETLNGRMFEGWPQTLPTVDSSLVAYLEFCNNGAKPPVVIVASGGTQHDVRAMRFGLGFTLLGNGYYAYDVGPTWHACNWWYPEYDIKLGQPLGPAQKVPQTVLWLREFEKGLVLWNPGFQAQTVTLAAKNGRQREVKIPMRDAVILPTQ